MAGVMAAWVEVAAELGYGPLTETPELIAAEIASVLDDRAEEGWDLTVETTTLAPTATVAA